MLHIIAKSFTKDDAKRLKGVALVTPQTFHLFNWEGQTVKGLQYYVDKAVKLGAVAVDKRETQKRTARKKAAK